MKPVWLTGNSDQSQLFLTKWVKARRLNKIKLFEKKKILKERETSWTAHLIKKVEANFSLNLSTCNFSNVSCLQSSVTFVICGLLTYVGWGLVRETWVQSLGWEDPLDKGKATHSNILAWRISWTIQSMRSQRVRYNWATFTFTLYKWENEASTGYSGWSVMEQWIRVQFCFLCQGWHPM